MFGNTLGHTRTYLTPLHPIDNVLENGFFHSHNWSMMMYHAKGCHHMYDIILHQEDHFERIYKHYSDFCKKAHNNKLTKKDKKILWKLNLSFPKWRKFVKRQRKSNKGWLSDEKSKNFFSKHPIHTLDKVIHNFTDAMTRFESKNLPNHYPRPKTHNSKYTCFLEGKSIHIKNGYIKFPAGIGVFKLPEPWRIPSTKKLAKHGHHIISTTLSYRGNICYGSITTNEPAPKKLIKKSLLHDNYGIDVNLNKNHGIVVGDKQKRCTVANFINITKTTAYERIERAARLNENKCQRCPNNWFKEYQETLSKTPKKERKNINIKWFDNYKSPKRRKAEYWFHKREHQLVCLAKGYIRARTIQIIKMHPKSITIEHLDIKEMLSDHWLAHNVQASRFGYFFRWLKYMCSKYGIELRRVSKYYPSSKICSRCHRRNFVQFNGHKAHDLGIRTFICPYCGLVINRDENASLNLAESIKYQVLVPA